MPKGRKPHSYGLTGRGVPNDVKITEHEDGGAEFASRWRWLDLRYEEVDALRAHFVAEIDDPNHAYVIGYRKALDDVAERMPEDVQKLVEEARTNILDGFSLDPYGKARRAREARGDLIRRLADALEAAYSQKGTES